MFVKNSSRETKRTRRPKRTIAIVASATKKNRQKKAKIDLKEPVYKKQLETYNLTLH